MLIQKVHWIKTARATYTLIGVLFGFCFPIFGTLLELAVYDLSFTMENFIKFQKMNAPLLYIIDTAPFFLGLFAFYAGFRQDLVITENTKRKRAEKELEKHRDNLEELVEMRTRELQKALKDREELHCELQEAFDRINVLDGLVPICSNCKKIRDDKGFWNVLEGYISSHSNAKFTHGICPECVKELYGDILDKK